ncbi:HAMP domain-containing sensor histidine kinase [Streptomyces sp. NPDC005706]|uniref:sensor histidine kinase n=1 Tax=Streptomyces sp. NPDC005706 TaxID=3157169 RepID=UPI0033EB568B
MLTVAVAGCAVAVLMARRQAQALRRRNAAREATVHDRLRSLHALVSDADAALRTATQDRGALAPPGTRAAQPIDALEQDLRRVLDAALSAASRQQVHVLVTIARRLQFLVTRSLTQLDELERDVEDPELMDRLFRVDHLTTRTRRAVESLAVLGGAFPRRIRTPVPLATVLRQAVAETENYQRVRVLPAPDASVLGHAAVDLVHLLAELVENATKWAPPESEVQVRAGRVGVGLAVEIDDRGLPIPPDQRARLNQLIASPEHIDVGLQLQDGRIGLVVVAQLARRHSIVVQLDDNIFGGTRAVVVVPDALLFQPQEEQDPPDLASQTSVTDRAPRHPGASAEPAIDARALQPFAGHNMGPGGSAPPGSPQSVAAAAADEPQAGSGRPRLPRRTGSYLPSELLEGAPRKEPAPANPSLMASYARGVERARTDTSFASPGADHK